MTTTDSDKAFPSGAVEPGSYDCTWNIAGAEVQGSIELEGGKFPRGRARFNLASCSVPNGLAFPRSENRDRVDGFIDAVGRHVTLVDVTVTTTLDNVTFLDATFALVGFDLDGDHDLRFDRACFQTSGLELATGFIPLTSTTFPRAYDPEKMRWTATSEGGTARSWDDKNGSFKMEFTSSAVVADPYRFRVRFAPWATVKVSKSISVKEWRDHWCGNLVTLVSAATGRAEKLTHLTFRTADSVVTVFTAAITQNPYYAEQDRSTPVCYRIGSDGGDSPLAVLRHIQSKRAEGHPLIDGYAPVILSRAQHPRSRVLQLVQWLEAGYGFDTIDEWEVRVEKHRTKRAELLKALKAAQDDGTLTSAQLKFAKDSIGKTPRSTLDSTLKAVFDRHPGLEPRRRLKSLPVIATQMEDENCTTVESAVRGIRNGLSHGSQTYNVHELDQLADVLRQLVRADYLTLLGCGYEASEVFPPGE